MTPLERAPCPLFMRLPSESRADHAIDCADYPNDPWVSTSSPEPDPAVFHEIGDVLFTVVNLARQLNVDPELSLRSATSRFSERVTRRVASG